MFLAKIDWAPSETLFKIGSFGVHYYSLMFVIAFGLGYYLMKKIFEKENIPIETLESLFVYMVVSILLGARLGDVFFYSWDYYQDHLLEILLPIRETADGYTFTGFRGLASHGAVIGVLIGIYLFQKKFKDKSLLWLLDHLTIFFNNRETLPRHPAQLYEALCYLCLFFALRYTYKSATKHKDGYLFGLFFTGMFSIRFLIEFIKESQGGFEEVMPFFTTGQWLSIPLIVMGLILILRKNKVSES
jgi:prolipoprotein diacylglyceryltransferase